MEQKLMQKDFTRGAFMVLGGAKSGKSRFALDLCNDLEGERIFIATAQPLDQEMRKRIEIHRSERGADWMTVEEPVDVGAVIERYDRDGTVILLDCVTLWLNNLLMHYQDDEREIHTKVEELSAYLEHMSGRIVIVSNDVGMGIVPGDPLSRKYRDLLGMTNQMLARACTTVVMLMAGLPLVLKKDGLAICFPYGEIH